MSWVDEIIEEGTEIIVDFDVKKAVYYIDRSLSLLSDCGIDKTRVGMQTKKQRVIESTPDTDDYLEDVKTLVIRFKRIKAEIESGEKGAGGTTINVTANAKSEASAVSIASFSETCAEIEALETLGEGDKAELIDLMNDARKKKEDKPLLVAAVKALVEKAAEFGFDALIKVIPFVWGLMQSGVM